VALGRLGKPVGLRGELKLRESADFWIEALSSRQLVLEFDDQARPVRVEAASARGAGLHVVRLAGVADRDAAAALVGGELVLEFESLDVEGPPSLRPFQLRDARVLLPDGTELGNVADVLRMPAHDVLVVRGGEREYLIPAVDAIVKEVDLEAGRVRIDPPAGLLEL
jgi:16S rRNA processing protein RimM